jgi:hypothetical protein
LDEIIKHTTRHVAIRLISHHAGKADLLRIINSEQNTMNSPPPYARSQSECREINNCCIKMHECEQGQTPRALLKSGIRLDSPQNASQFP